MTLAINTGKEREVDVLNQEYKVCLTNVEFIIEQLIILTYNLHTIYVFPKITLFMIYIRY